MHVTTDLTRTPPHVVVYRNEYADADDPLWGCQINADASDGGACVTFLADSPEAIAALGRAILTAAAEHRSGGTS